VNPALLAVLPDQLEQKVMRESVVSLVQMVKWVLLESPVLWARLAHQVSKGLKVLLVPPVSPESLVVPVKLELPVPKVPEVKLVPKAFPVTPEKLVFPVSPVLKDQLVLKASKVTLVPLVPWDHEVAMERMDFLVKLELRESPDSTVKTELMVSPVLPVKPDQRDIREKLVLLVKVVSMALTEKLAHKDRLVPKVPVERLDQLVSAV